MSPQPGHHRRHFVVRKVDQMKAAEHGMDMRLDLRRRFQYQFDVVMGKEELNTKTPVAPIDMTKDLCCPLLGLFGNEDRAPSPEQVNQHEAELKKHGKTYEFHRYDGAGHGFFYWHRPLYRPEQAMDGWSKVFAFFGKHLAK
jgi:carboxymethylenebutenolidase